MLSCFSPALSCPFPPVLSCWWADTCGSSPRSPLRCYSYPSHCTLAPYTTLSPSAALFALALQRCNASLCLTRPAPIHPEQHAAYSPSPRCIRIQRLRLESSVLSAKQLRSTAPCGRCIGEPRTPSFTPPWGSYTTRQLYSGSAPKHSVQQHRHRPMRKKLGKRSHTIHLPPPPSTTLPPPLSRRDPSVRKHCNFRISNHWQHHHLQSWRSTPQMQSARR